MIYFDFLYKDYKYNRILLFLKYNKIILIVVINNGCDVV